jgi:integrase
MSIILRNGTYYLRRRIPSQFSQIDNRKEVWLSLKTDSKRAAQGKAELLWDTLLQAWDSRLRGHSEDAEVSFEAAQQIAKSRGFRYAPINEVADLPLADILDRVEALELGDTEIETAAILGTAEKPSLTIGMALEAYWPISRDKTLSKSQDQLRRWVNPRKKAVANFINVVGDVRLSDLTAEHMLQFRGWWIDRLQEEGLTANSANKDFTHLGHILKTVNGMKRLGHTLHLESLAFFTEKDGESRPPFSDSWITEKLLTTDALNGLNAEARAIFLGMINTGYRPGEAAGLTPDRICLEANIPHIKIAAEDNREIKNQTSKREIPLTGVSLEAFRAFPNGFPTYREKPAVLSATVNKFLKSNELKETDRHVFYSLRHSFEDRLLRADVDERVRRDLLGHALGRERYGEGGGLAYKLKMINRIAF